MEKALSDITTFFSFFIFIPCKTKKQSVRCKRGASWSAVNSRHFVFCYSSVDFMGVHNLCW